MTTNKKEKIVLGLLITTTLTLLNCSGSGGSKSGSATGNGTPVSNALMAGQVDPSFGSSGYASTLSGATSSAVGAAFQSTGQLVLLFRDKNGTGTSYLNRYSATGVLDSSFGISGQANVFCTNTCSGNKVLVQSDDKILVVNGVLIASHYTFSLIRLNADGSLDSTYGTTGVSTAGTGNVSAAFVDPSNNVVIAGSLNTSAGAFLERLLPTGALDVTFNLTGVLTFSSIPGTTGTPSITASIYDSFNHEYVTAANAGVANLVGQVLNTAVVDPNFGTAGAAASMTAGTITALALQSDGKILLGSASGANIQIVRFLANGSMDTTFGTAGTASLTSGTIANGTVNNIFVDGGGNILVVYAAQASTSSIILRLGSAGASDASFGSSGYLTLPGLLVNDSKLLASGHLVLAVTDPSGAQLAEIR